MYKEYIVLKKTGAALPRRDTMAERDTLKEERAEPEAALTPPYPFFIKGGAFFPNPLPPPCVKTLFFGIFVFATSQ